MIFAMNRLYPVIDRPGGASIRHWITVLEEAADKAEKAG